MGCDYWIRQILNSGNTSVKQQRDNTSKDIQTTEPMKASSYRRRLRSMIVQCWGERRSFACLTNLTPIEAFAILGTFGARVRQKVTDDVACNGGLVVA